MEPQQPSNPSERPADEQPPAVLPETEQRPDVSAHPAPSGPTQPGPVPPPFALPEAGDQENATKPAGRGPAATFFIGIVLVLVGAGSLLFSSGPRGGVMLIGALVFGGVLIVRAIAAHRDAVSQGAAPLSSTAKAVAIGALAVSVAFAGFAGYRQLETVGLTETAGSCWTLGEGDELFLVPCSGAHDYVVTDETTSPDSCPATSEGYVYSKTGAVLCLQPA